MALAIFTTEEKAGSVLPLSILTNSQWIEASRPGADPSLARHYRDENRRKEQDNMKKEPSIEVGEPIAVESGDENQRVVDRTTFEVKHSALDSFGWDWFIETTRSTNASGSVVSNYYVQTAVIIIYNTNPKDWGTPKYGQAVQQVGRTRSLVMDAGGLRPQRDLPYSPSQLMKDFIQGARDYHCGGCLSTPTVLDKYWNFILSPKEPGSNRLTPNGVHR